MSHLPDATIAIHRADGTTEFDAETDAFNVLCAQTEGAIRSLDKLGPQQLRSRFVAALLVTGKQSGGEMHTNNTLSLPTNPEFAGALLFLGLRSVRKHNPAAFAALMRRLTDSGLLSTGLIP